MKAQHWRQAPRIGISTAYQDGKQIIESNYIRAVEGAGGMPVIIPMVASIQVEKALVERLDGLIIVGGPAITQGLVGELPHDLKPTDPVRTASDDQILEIFLGTGKPILGICYGMQLLNAHAGGTLYADVQNQLPETLIHGESRGAQPHPINLKADSTLRRILGLEALVVNSNHIQALADVGKGFKVTATAPDGVIEAIEHREAPIMGVQFHPERMLDAMLPLFKHLVQGCRSESGPRNQTSPQASTK